MENIENKEKGKLRPWVKRNKMVLAVGIPTFGGLCVSGVMYVKGYFRGYDNGRHAGYDKGFKDGAKFKSVDIGKK